MSNTRTVLIAVGMEEGVRRAVTATRALFGDDVHAVFAHVAGSVPLTPPGGIAPVGSMGAAVIPSAADIEHGLVDPDEIRASAREVARHAADSSGLSDTEAIGLLGGDPADELAAEAAERGVDAIVVAAHDRNWLSRLIVPSVTDEIERVATVPVIVVPEG
jgi:nucleotide-binding universal stress UspA family protein